MVRASELPHDPHVVGTGAIDRRQTVERCSVRFGPIVSIEVANEAGPRTIDVCRGAGPHRRRRFVRVGDDRSPRALLADIDFAMSADDPEPASVVEYGIERAVASDLGCDPMITIPM